MSKKIDELLESIQKTLPKTTKGVWGVPSANIFRVVQFIKVIKPDLGTESFDFGKVIVEDTSTVSPYCNFANTVDGEEATSNALLISLMQQFFTLYFKDLEEFKKSISDDKI